jgi:hypothetical protein
MIRRTMDAAFLNGVANHPDVRPWLEGPVGPLDLSPLLDDARNHALVNDCGGFVYLFQEPGLYEVHSLLLPEGRAGSSAAAMDGLRHMFTRTDCVEVQTRVPEANKAALGLTRAMGFARLFDRPGNGYWSLTLDRWRARDPELAAHGERFHVMLEIAKAATGSTLPTHDDDEAHDRAAGASLLMAEAGQVAKAVRTYNRWARFAGYQSIEMRSDSVIDARDALLGVSGGIVEVLKCQ